MRWLVVFLTLAGMAVSIGTVFHEGAEAVMAELGTAGWLLLLLVPLHVVAIALDAVGWKRLLLTHRPPGLAYLTWAAVIRESIDGLLPVARMGGGVAGMDLLCAQSVPLPVSAASVVAELTVTLITQALFVLVGVVLLVTSGTSLPWIGWIVAGCMALSLPLVFVLMAVQRQTQPFRRLSRLMHYVFHARLAAVERVARIDEALAELFGRPRVIAVSSLWQFSGLLVTALEVWVVLRVMGRPVSMADAVVLESLGQALRSVAFIVPAGLGVQEVGMVAFGTLVGLAPDLSLALSLAKRLRDVLLGSPALLSWVWYQARYLRQPER